VVQLAAVPDTVVEPGAAAVEGHERAPPVEAQEAAATETTVSPPLSGAGEAERPVSVAEPEGEAAAGAVTAGQGSGVREAAELAQAPEASGTKATEAGLTATSPGDTVAGTETDGEPLKCMVLAGQKFTSRAEVAETVKRIQESLDKEGGGQLGPQDAFLMFHLMLHHPKAVGKMTSPVLSIRYGTYEKFHNKCFIMVRKDGTEEGVSWSKSLEAIFPRKGSSRPVDSAEACAGDAGAPAAQQGLQRNKEQADMEDKLSGTGQMRRGCVLDIRGVPGSMCYHRLRDLLGNFGRLRSLWLPYASKRPRSETTGAMHRPAAIAPDDNAVGQASARRSEAARDTVVPMAPTPSAAAAPGLATADQAAAEEEGEDGEDNGAAADEPVAARCCFVEPEAALRALHELVEVDGAKVKVGLLAGAEEEAFWERLSSKGQGGKGQNKGKYNNKGRDKGKDKGKGKAKDKGRGKGKVKVNGKRKAEGEAGGEGAYEERGKDKKMGD